MTCTFAHFTKLKPTINPVKCHYIKAEQIKQFYQRNQMISEDAWNLLMRIGGSIYSIYSEGYIYCSYKHTKKLARVGTIVGWKKVKLE